MRVLRIPCRVGAGGENPLKSVQHPSQFQPMKTLMLSTLLPVLFLMATLAPSSRNLGKTTLAPVLKQVVTGLSNYFRKQTAPLKAAQLETMSAPALETWLRHTTPPAGKLLILKNRKTTCSPAGKYVVLTRQARRNPQLPPSSPKPLRCATANRTFCCHQARVSVAHLLIIPKRCVEPQAFSTRLFPSPL